MKKRLLLFHVFMQGFIISFIATSCNDYQYKNEASEEQNEQIQKFEGDLAVGPKLPIGKCGIAIRYRRSDKNYSDWCLWIWENNETVGQIYDFSETDDFGAVCFLPLTTFSENVLTNGLGIITRKLDTWDGQSSDMMLDFASFTADENGYYNIFVSDKEDTLFDNPDLIYQDKIKSAVFLSGSRIKIETTNPMKSCTIYENDDFFSTKDNVNSNILFIDLDEFPNIDSSFKVEVTFKESLKTLENKISIRGLFSTNEFNDLYYYNGDLGALYSEERTSFKVWSPLSDKIELRIYDSGTPTTLDATVGSDVYQSYEMVKDKKGVFSYEVNGDLDGKYYTYVVTNSKYVSKEIVDPYAKSTGVNGLRGMIVDFSKTNPSNWENALPNDYKRTELAIYETHVADVTSSETWGGTPINSKKFNGMYESKTTYTENNVTVKTGFDHIKELGVNAVQLLPIFDQANDEIATGDDAFNWGYNPLNYNSLDGIYSSNPYDGYQKIKEFKELVKAYNDAGINIIMDVVYNHVNGSEGSNFDVLMPEYYFRYTADGKYSNGSGCGNEFASENLMARKFIVDSTEFWASEYRLGGFRFDLMGLHDLETMNEVTKNLKENVNENIFVHGEPWTGGTTTLLGNLQASQTNINLFQGYGAFNNKIRDSLIKGGLSEASAKGWATDNSHVNASDELLVKNGILGYTGTTCTDPLKATNYVTCHDNYTLYDRIKVAYTNGEDTSLVPSDKVIAEMATLANAVVFTSQGTSFMLAGEEMLRSKGGDNNSYESGYFVNELDYSRLIDFANVYNNYKNLIKFKATSGALSFTDANEIKNNVKFNESTSGVIDYSISVGEDVYRIIHVSFGLENIVLNNLDNCQVILDTKNNEIKDGEITLSSSESLIIKISV